MNFLCSDLEGVFIPEVWINVAEKTGIPELRRTTRDEPDYGKLMRFRMALLREKGLKLKDIQDVIATIRPIDGANEMLDWIKHRMPMCIVSDTFTQFADPLIAQLNRPTLFCNELIIDQEGYIAGFALRQPDQKRKVVQAMQSLNYTVIAMGDSYNDTSMLIQAEHGILYRPPENVIRDFPQFPVATGYDELKTLIANVL
ncbi:MAG TPA: bifunctional phosphoserine phosphatase/homoserine phosphotransferase ThrH [Bacteroidales bacterium]|nr:bifunctional phosphoserine phosphatase/homoserine phosphotransferase ThrH [Bacteroidales bacterium]HPM93891.1 bifunctional phosphoserine phosphatase/homoserine phosphotransferase ThrH [Bacteroidales bacterium]